MTKFSIAFILMIGSVTGIFGQNAQQQVASVSGDDVTVNDVQLSWTLGQVVSASNSNNSIFLDEGFQQGTTLTIPLGAGPEENIITIYPNPTTDYIQVNTSSYKGFGGYQLQSLKGAILLQDNQADFTEEIKIDMMDHASGTYLLTIQMPNSQTKQFKIIKN